MKVSIAAILFSLALVLMSATSCFDQPPGEISVIATNKGQRQFCTVLVFNSKDVQVKQKNTHQDGQVYIDELQPSTYTLKFKDANGDMYPAVVEVQVRPNGSEVVNVELSEAPATPEA